MNFHVLQASFIWQSLEPWPSLAIKVERIRTCNSIMLLKLSKRSFSNQCLEEICSPSLKTISSRGGTNAREWQKLTV